MYIQAQRYIPLLHPEAKTLVSHLESAKSRELRGNVGCVGSWVRDLRGSNYYVGCVGYVDQNIFYVVITFTWVAWVNYIFAWVFAWVKNFCLGQFFGGSSKKNLNWRFHNNILVADKIHIADVKSAC